MGLSRQEYWTELPCAPPGDLPNPGIEPRSPTLPADSLVAEKPGKNEVFEEEPLLSNFHFENCIVSYFDVNF